MKLALLSDLHANVQALDACLAHARAQGVTRLAFLGDLVGYGGDPGTVLDRVMALAADGAVVLRGNHDEMALSPPAEVRERGEESAQWTHEHLSPAQREFLAQRPLTHCEDTLLLVHASAHTPERWVYVTNDITAQASLDAALQAPPEGPGGPAVRHVFGGHVHQQSLYYRGSGRQLMAFQPTPGVAVPTPRHRHWLATVGSVGQPRDGRPEAMYAVFDQAQMAVTFHRVPYDHAAAARRIRAAGLPTFFADRLEHGQ